MTDNNGFVSGVGFNEKNVLTLKDGGSYEYVKAMGSLNADTDVLAVIAGSAEKPEYFLYYVYTGSYAKEGDQVTLNIADECVFSEDWGALVGLGYMKNSEGAASNGDRVSNYEGTDYDPMDNFSTPVYKFGGHDTPVSVTIKADGTYTYNAAASSDDD